MTLFKDSESSTGTYCVHLLHLLSSFPDSPPPNRWRSGGWGTLREGGNSLAVRDRWPQTEVAHTAPHLKKRHPGARAGLLVGNLGLRRQIPPAPQTCSRTRTQGHPKVAPQSISTEDSQHHLVSPYLLSPSTDTPPSVTSAGREGAGGPTPPLPPGTPRDGLGMQGMVGRARQAQRGA